MYLWQMLDFFKAIVEKLRVDLLLASLAIAILLLKIFGFDIWWLFFTFSSAYIVLLCVEKGVRGIRQKRELQKRAIDKARKAKKDEERLNDEVWKRFYALDATSLGVVKTIYLAEKDPSNPLIHYIHDCGALAYEIDRSYDYRILYNNNVYRPLLYAEHIANATVVTFQPYYMELVAHYVESGKKERVQQCQQWKNRR